MYYPEQVRRAEEQIKELRSQLPWRLRVASRIFGITNDIERKLEEFPKWLNRTNIVAIQAYTTATGKILGLMQRGVNYLDSLGRRRKQ